MIGSFNQMYVHVSPETKKLTYFFGCKYWAFEQLICPHHELAFASLFSRSPNT